MTEKDRERFNKIVANLRKKFDEEKASLTLEQRIENLEEIVFFSLMCDAGEQGVTPEQREVMKRLGWDRIFYEALHG